jgi:HK97 gp10 family phage protein
MAEGFEGFVSDWNGEQVSVAVNKCMQDNLDLAGFSTLDVLQELVDRKQTTKKVGGKISEKSGKKIGGKKVGTNPSAPNTPPKRVTATLQKSYNWVQDRSFSINRQDGLQGRISSPLKYAKYLELGTAKMEPRPHLLLAFTVNHEKIVRALSRPCAGGL